MLSGLSFRSVFVFSINSLILSGFPLTSFYLVKANLVPRAILKNWKPFLRLPLIAIKCAGVKVELKHCYLLYRDFIFLCVQLSKNITKCFLFIIVQIFSTHFAVNLFYLHIFKTYGTMEQQPHGACEWTKSKQKKKNKKKSRHIWINHAFFCSI